MKSIDSLITELNEYLKENKPKYLYNTDFTPGESTVLYSGPYWDNKEIIAGVDPNIPTFEGPGWMAQVVLDI